MCRHHHLEPVDARDVGAEPEIPRLSGMFGDRQRQRRPGLPQPDLRGIDTVPMRDLARRQQELDCRRGAAAAIRRAVAPHLGIVPALRMGCETQAADHFGGVHPAAVSL
jgi:hypothetical protein